MCLRLLNEPMPDQKPVWFVIDELASLQRLPQLHTAITENRKSQNPVILGFQGRSQMEARYGQDAEAMLSQPATKIFLRTTEPRAAKWVSEAIGEVEIERLRETHYDGSRAGKNFALDRQTEPLVLPSEVSGLDDLRGFLKYGNHVARFSFPFIALREKNPGFDERKMDDLIIPSTPLPPEPEEMQGNLLGTGTRCPTARAPGGVIAHAYHFKAIVRWSGTDISPEGIHGEGAELLVTTGCDRGEWQGRLAAQFGLAGAVSAEDFGKLSQGQHPETGEQLVRQRASYEYQDADGKTVKTMEHRAGWDATFSAPKSVSLTALVGGDDRVREAHRESVSTALEQLEYYTQARIGGNHPPETTGKFIAAKFEHDTARPVDGYVAPQLHTHAVVFNLTERENGQARAIQPQSLFASQQFATAVYQSELTYRLKDLGYEITVGRSGAPEIKGYTQEYLDASSPRSQQIREYLERTGRNGREAAEIAAHSTRDRKEIHSPGEVMAAHRKLAADFGHQADAVVRAARDRQQHQERPANTVDRVRESLTFSRDKNFEREAVVDERALIRDGLRRGMGDITFAQVRGNLNARIASGEFQAVERAHMPGRQFTTAKTIAAEREIIGRVREGRSQIEPLLPRSQAIAFADQQQQLNRTQRSVVEDVLSSPDRIQGIQGFAGSGKTTTLSVIRSAAEIQGFQVEGFAPTSRAARQLGEAGVEAGTLQGFLARSTAPSPPEQKTFLFRGRIEPCKHQPDARVSLPSRSSGPCVVDWRYATASGRRSWPTI